MSWYFFGGFSAYAMVPSGRWWNHSGCFCHPRVVRRALEREVQGDLQAQLAGRRDEVVEVLDGAQVGVDGVVAALGRADRPGHPDVVRRPRTGCCWGPCGRWCRWGGSAAGTRTSKPIAAIAGSRRRRSGRCPTGGCRLQHGALRAREELVPGAVQRPLPLHQQRQRRTRRDQFAQRVAGQHRRPPPGCRAAASRAGGGRVVVAQRVDGGQERVRVGPRSSGRRRRPARTARRPPRGPVPVSMPAGILMPASCRQVADRVASTPRRCTSSGPARRGDVGAPAVGARGQLAHRRPGAGAALRVAQDDVGGDRVVALAEDGGGDLEGLADDGLRRTAAAPTSGRTSRTGMRPIVVPSGSEVTEGGGGACGAGAGFVTGGAVEERASDPGWPETDGAAGFGRPCRAVCRGRFARARVLARGRAALGGGTVVAVGPGPEGCSGAVDRAGDEVSGAGEGVSGVAGGPAVSFGGIGGVPVVGVGGADEWCVAGMTAPVRVNVGGRMDAGRVSCVVYPSRVPGEPSHPFRAGNPALC